MISNHLSLFMSISNLIQTNIHFIDKKRHMLIYFLDPWWIGEKSEIVIK
jgi:hypothetical protein